MFSDTDYRDQLLQTLDNLAVIRFWNDFDLKSQSDRSTDLFPLLRRLDTFYTNTTLMTMTCHPDALDIRGAIAQNKIILVSLAADAAEIGELERQMIGAAIVSQIQMAVMAGAVTSPPFILYIDEAQHFVTTALPEMLSEARQKGLGLVLSNQYFKQLVGETLDALEGNVATLAAFEVGESDAKELVSYFKPQFDVADLVSLGNYRMVVSTRHQNERVSAFSVDTLPPPAHDGDENQAKQREAEIRARSVANYTPKPYSEVLTWLKNRYTSKKASVKRPTNNQQADDEWIEPKTTP